MLIPEMAFTAFDVHVSEIVPHVSWCFTCAALEESGGGIGWRNRIGWRSRFEESRGGVGLEELQVDSFGSVLGLSAGNSEYLR